LSQAFSGSHSFSSSELGEEFESAFMQEGDISGEVFFLQASHHAPLAMSETMQQGGEESMLRAMASSHVPKTARVLRYA
jgi:hypothetical protein